MEDDKSKSIFAPLSKYKETGSFLFKPNDQFIKACNVPKRDVSGIYIIEAIKNDQSEIVYIGISGRKDKNGNIIHRKGGIRDRICNGYHPGTRIKRHSWFPLKIKEDKVDAIKISWWITYNELVSDYPWVIENNLLVKYKETFGLGRKPRWHSNKNQ